MFNNQRPCKNNLCVNNPGCSKPEAISNDVDPDPFVVNIRRATLQNNYFRTALWTGKNLQLTLMTIKPGEDIGLEMHSDLDQFLQIEQGQGIVMIGKCKDDLSIKKRVFINSVIIIPAGTWHNLINTCRIPLKLYSVYAPVQHPYGTVHKTKEDAMEQEEHH